MATATTTQQPLPQFAPYMNDYWARAQDVANVGYQQSPGSYVGPNQTMQQGWQAIQNRAMSGNPAMNAAEQGLQNFYTAPQQGATANPYANPNNPYLRQQIDAAQGDVVRNWNNVQRPAWDTRMASSGSFGNANVASAAQNAESDMVRNLGRISTDMRMGAYNQAAGLRESFAGRNDAMYGANQNRMLNAYSMAPTFAANDYLDANALMGVAGQQQQFQQAAQNQNLDWWNQAQGFAGNQLDAYGRRLGMIQPGTQTTQSTPNPSTINQVIGGAIAGAGLGNWWGG